MDSLEDTILNSLLANLDEKTVSRSGDSLNKKIEEARNLTDLSKKLKKFKSTPEAERIDLTEYEAKINSRLAKLPTLKPIAGKLEGYGPRTHPIFGYRHFHGAVDMGAPTGTPIKAAAAGPYNRNFKAVPAILSKFLIAMDSLHPIFIAAN